MLEKRFNSKKVERDCIREWECKNIFSIKEKQKVENFCIMMPPPNITGSLHMGHALTFTLQDILIRYQKKIGKNILWQAGTDHAGIATELIVEKKVLKESNVSKKELGRDEFLNQIWKWKKFSGDTIINQLKRLGACIDWKRSRFTMDDGLSKSVIKVFVNLYNEGLIYKDKRLVNWDPVLQTAVSDLEVNQNDIKGKLWYLKYYIADSNEEIVIATTRPETLFGDSAIAIHPQNSELKKYIGKRAIIPICNREIPIISDKYADPEKGSGAVKITPGHDFNDFEIGIKHNLKVISIFDLNAKLNTNVPKPFVGLDRFVARKKILKILKEKNILVKSEVNEMKIPIGDRSGSIIEPLLTDQWFCNAKKLCEPIKSHIKKGELKFFPSNWINSFNYWIENIKPWCISRQIWWGHRIPAWYTTNGKIIVAENEKEAKRIAKEKFNLNDANLKQDSDVLDTWFSSALWPFTTLGWPEHTKDYKAFYPTDVLITGFDIIFFWVARMVMMGIHFTKKIPFKNVYIHPLVKDESGKKMSKSKGNVIDPLDLINKFGADALRYTLASLSSQGRDIKLSNKLVENSRNFNTKLWNVAKFYEISKFKDEKEFFPYNCKLLINKWIYTRFYETQVKLLKYLDRFQFNFASSTLYQFVWNDFCDLYIEFVKPYLDDKDYFEEINNTFNWVFKNLLNLLNPFIPFITEEIAMQLGFTDEYNLIESKFLILKPNVYSTEEINKFEDLVMFIRNFRKFKKDNPIKFEELLIFSNKKKVKWLVENELIIKSLFKISKLKYTDNKNSQNYIVFFSTEVKFGILKKDNIEIITNVEKKINFLKNEVNFFKKKLSNKSFVKNAPKTVVDEQRIKLNKAEKNLNLLITQKKTNVSN